MIKLTYFSFTTLSTVGFGDMHPRGNSERLAGVGILLIGVLVTSVFMENFSNVIKTINSVHLDFEESDELSVFLRVMERYNGGLALEETVVNKLQIYFQYRWKNHKNIAVSTLEDVMLLEKLPDETQNQIYLNFLFKGLIE